MNRPHMPGLILELILAVLVLAILGGAELVKSRATSVVPVKPPVVTHVVVTVSPVASPPPLAPTPTPVPSYVFVMSDLGLMFAAPGSLPDLVAVPVRSSGTSSSRTVALGDKQLTGAGCPASEAPLGSVTLEPGMDGRVVATVDKTAVRYLEPIKKCPAAAPDATQVLASALSSLIAIPR